MYLDMESELRKSIKFRDSQSKIVPATHRPITTTNSNLGNIWQHNHTSSYGVKSGKENYGARVP